jgi:hypothetical protein
LPILPPTGPSPAYDDADAILNLARTRLNDCPLALSGNLLSNTQPYTQTIFNGAFQHLQEDLADYGEPRLVSETVIYALPPVSGTDPATQVYINQAQYFDGQNYYFPPGQSSAVVTALSYLESQSALKYQIGTTSTPNWVLPQDMILPLRLWERQAGTQNIFTPMFQSNDGLMDCPKTGWLRTYDWREDAIYMPGALIARDIRLRYAAYLADLETVGSVQWYQQPVPMYRCRDSLAHYVCAEFAFSRGSNQAVAVGNSFLAQGQASMRRIVNRQLRQKQRGNHRRRPYASGRHQGWGYW